MMKPRLGHLLLRWYTSAKQLPLFSCCLCLGAWVGDNLPCLLLTCYMFLLHWLSCDHVRICYHVLTGKSEQAMTPVLSILGYVFFKASLEARAMHAP